ncbi:uncharacterized protein PRCAT00006128001 [Priceomyces carsonii]|uniref:uncharacterized protein n=1 Tax=Priceomyces carsonii TaxID=28549 RepID=UPI002ED7E67C|nr:unnamed protein product [Priceomyces carsonii]
MFHINFYSRFFNLNTDTFFLKIQRALNPLNKSSSPTETDQSDDEVTELYGFIWITGTLIFLMFVSSTGSNLLSEWLHSDKKHKYEYNFDLLTKSISLFYGYNILFPLAFYLGTSYVVKFPERISLTKLISIFGYTNVLWFPITIINFLIVIFVSNKSHHLILNVLEWVIVLASGLVTGLSNISKVSPIVMKNCLLLNDGNSSASNKLHLVVLGVMAAAHLVFTISVKAIFFGIVV